MKLSEAAGRLNSRSSKLPALIFLTDQARVPDVAAVAAKLPTGSAIILRDYTAPNRQEIARSLAQLTHQHDLVLLIGGDVELAGAVGADGVHFREQDLTCRADEIARQRLRARLQEARLLAARGDLAAARELLLPALIGADPQDLDLLEQGAAEIARWCQIGVDTVRAAAGRSSTP